MVDAGGIEYTVSVETDAAFKAADQFDKSLDKVQKTADRTDTSANKLNASTNKLASSIKRANSESGAASSAFAGLGKVMGSIIALIGSKVIIDLADEYTEMSSRVRQVTADTAEFEKVQARLLQTANSTYRPLAEAAEVYIRTSGAIKDLGYNTDQVMDITDSFSYLLVTNAASSERAASSINAYSKAIQTGIVSSETWQSILAAMPSVVSDIASATGETENRIRELGITGKLSLTALNEALLRSKDSNLELADAMDTTVSDSFVAFRNSMQVFIGKVNESSGATAGLAGAIGDMSTILQDPETIKAAQDLAAGVVVAFATIVQGVTNAVNAARWFGEEMAALSHGVAADDAVRLGKAYKDAAREVMNLQNASADYKKTQLWMQDNIRAQEKMTAAQKAYQAAVDATAPYKPRTSKPEKAPLVISENEAPKINAESTAIDNKAAATRALAKEQRDAAAFAKQMQDAEQANIDTVKALSEAIYQAGMDTKELAQRKAELSLNEYATPEQIEQVRALGGALSDINILMKRQEELKDKAKELDVDGSARDKFEQEKTDLQEMLELKMISEDEYRQYTLDAETTLKEQLMALDEERFAAQSKGHELLINSLNDMGSHATNAFMQFATGAKTGKDAVLAMGQAIAQSVVRQMVDMGVQMAINAVKEKLFAAQSVATAATSGAAIAAAYAPAAAAASVATGGGAAVVGSTALAGAVPAMLAMFGGGRQYGGGVEGNKFYKVNEGGAPEIFKGADGNQYMMPNQRGEVVSNKDATGGGGSVFNVTLHVEASEGMSTGDARDLGNEMSDAFVAGVRGVISGELESGGAIWHAVQG